MIAHIILFYLDFYLQVSCFVSSWPMNKLYYIYISKTINARAFLFLIRMYYRLFINYLALNMHATLCCRGLTNYHFWSHKVNTKSKRLSEKRSKTYKNTHENIVWFVWLKLDKTKLTQSSCNGFLLLMTFCRAYNLPVLIYFHFMPCVCSI